MPIGQGSGVPGRQLVPDCLVGALLGSELGFLHGPAHGGQHYQEIVERAANVVDLLSEVHKVWVVGVASGLESCCDQVRCIVWLIVPC